MRFASVFFVLVLFPLTAFSQETDIPCKDVAEVGRSVMMVRQSGVPIEKAMGLVLNGLKEQSPEHQKMLEPVYRKIVTLAYQEQQYSTNRDRIDATDKFVKSIFNRCARRLPRS